MTTFRDRDSLATTPAHETALDCVAAGIDAARPETVVRDAVSLDGDTLSVGDETYDLAAHDSVVVLGGGKAGAQVARALEAVLGDRLDGGVVVTDHAEETATVDVRPGSHPVPDAAGVESTRDLLDRAAAADEDTLVLAVITGGGSALLAAPAEGISLADLQATTDALLDSGADIHEINAVRKHLSAIKGGRLARTAAPATVATIVLSDVVGNDLDVIASGPTVPDSSTYEDARRVADRYDLDVPASVTDRLRRGAEGEAAETPGPDDPAFERTRTHVLADGFTALDAARDVAADRGFETLVLSSRLRGEAREAGLTTLAVAEEARATGNPVDPPAVVLSGGETTVTVRGSGTGGPNQECALRFAADCADADAAFAAVDTDGRDGSTDAAGALVDAETVTDRDEALATLADNDATPFLDARDALLHTGRTGTNVNDLRVLVLA
ncbi:MAG: glycerate kinase [Halobacteriaceae archaeon]